MRGFVRDLALALAAALAITLAVAAGAALRVADEQGWIAAGFYRLVVRTAWDRFDAWLPLPTAAALVATALVQVVRWWRGRAAPTRLRGALAAFAVLAALRAGTALEAWRAARGPNLLLVSIDTLRAALALLAVLAALRAGAELEAWRAARGPNLLLVSIDTLRADHLGATAMTSRPAPPSTRVSPARASPSPTRTASHPRPRRRT